MNVVDLMSTETRSLPPSATLREALALLAEGGFRHLPVVDEGKLVGIVSDRDLLGATGGIESERADRALSAVMHASPTTVTPADTLVSASVEMGLAKIGCLPVVDGEGVLVGLVTEADLLRAYLEVSRRGGAAEGSDPAVDRLMTANPRWVEPGSSLEDALALAAEAGFRHLPVLDDEERLVGVLSERDLCREVGRGGLPRTPVSSAMTRHVLTATQGEPVSAAAQRMLENKISCLPVLRGEALVGILSTADLVDHCMDTLGAG